MAQAEHSHGCHSENLAAWIQPVVALLNVWLEHRAYSLLLVSHPSPQQSPITRSGDINHCIPSPIRRKK